MNKLRWWITLGVTAVVGLSVFSFAGRYHQVVAELTAQDALALAQDKTARFGRWVRNDGSPEQFQASVGSALEDRTAGVHLAMLDENGRVLGTNTTPAFPLPDFSVPTQHLTNPAAWREPHAVWTHDAQNRRFAAAWLPIGPDRMQRTQPRRWSLAAIGEDEDRRRLSSLASSMLIRTLGLAFAAGVLTFLMVGLWTRSLASATDAAERIAHGELGLQNLDIPRSDSELRRLVLAFNTLMDRLRGLHSAQQRFVADAAHELRTPLTILRGEIQVALRKDREPEKYRAILQSNLEEVVRLSNLVEALLTLARADAHQLASPHAAIPVVALCRDIATKLTPLAEQKDIRILVESPADADPRVAGDPASLRRIVLNLVENAVRFSSPDDLVRIVIQPGPTHLRLDILDEGPGIAPEHLPHIFDRFYRVESARNRTSGGSGLGLAIVKALTEAAGGHITVTSDVGHGSTFTLTFPNP